MPHKRNPIRSERLTGMARILRGNAIAALENVALWHERDISHSSVERICMPDSCIITHFMLVETTNLVKNLLIYPENMARNLNCYGGVVFSQGVLLALVGKGLNREEAYSIVQSNAMAVWNVPGGDFHKLTASDPRVTAHLTPTEIEHCFDPTQHLKHLDEIYQRLSI
jgi:adenylosuccinate lyase